MINFLVTWMMMKAFHRVLIFPLLVILSYNKFIIWRCHVSMHQRNKKRSVKTREDDAFFNTNSNPCDRRISCHPSYLLQSRIRVGDGRIFNLLCVPLPPSITTRTSIEDRPIKNELKSNQSRIKINQIKRSPTTTIRAVYLRKLKLIPNRLNMIK